jgi:hypothetical protein
LASNFVDGFHRLTKPKGSTQKSNSLSKSGLISNVRPGVPLLFQAHSHDETAQNYAISPESPVGPGLRGFRLFFGSR